jgi:hypothetical protein
MASEVRRVFPCASRRNHLGVLLSSPQDLNWANTSADHIKEDILDDKFTEKVLSCPCPSCTSGRKDLAAERDEISVWLGKAANSKRLLATCIVAGRAWLIYAFLQNDIDDDIFDTYVTEIDLTAKSGLSPEDARALLSRKEDFFDGGRIGLFTYIRSIKKPKDRPAVDEKNWLINEFLALLAKLALAPDAQVRKLPTEPTAARIRDITIRDSPARLKDRTEEDAKEEGIAVLIDPETEGAITDLGDQEVCMQSLGYLLFDLIWFFAGGGNCVLALDKHRTQGVDWIKRTGWKQLNQIPDLFKAFQIVWIMICPNPDFGFSKNDQGRENFGYLSQLLLQIWPHSTSEPLIDPQKGKDSDLTSLLGQGLGDPGNSTYVDVEPEISRWM